MFTYMLDNSIEYFSLNFQCDLKVRYDRLIKSSVKQGLYIHYDSYLCFGYVVGELLSLSASEYADFKIPTTYPINNDP